MINENSPLIFTHIPKTGGMSMFASMSEYYGMDIADMYDMSAFDNNANDLNALLRDASKSVYTGHFPFGLHEWFSRPSYYMAIVRNPIDRIESLYLYSLQFRDVIHNTIKETGFTLNDLFSKRMVADFYVEFEPWIKGDKSFASFLRCNSPELQNAMVRRFSGMGMDPTQPNKDTLELAKANIEQYFSIVGVQERYQDTLQIVRDSFDINITEYRVNKGPEKTKKVLKLNVGLKKRLKEMNKLDTELYEWVLTRFNTQLLNPIPPKLIDGGKREDFENVKLWRAIGSSPMRQSVMENSRMAGKK